MAVHVTLTSLADGRTELHIRQANVPESVRLPENHGVQDLTRQARRLLNMEDPEAYLRALTAPLAGAREGSPLPVTRFSLEAVANAFVMLGLLPAARAEQILAAQRPVLEAAGFRLGTAMGELSVRPGAGGYQEARAAGADSLQKIPLAVAAGPVRCRLPGYDLVITWATLTPEGIWLRYHGDARAGEVRVLEGYGHDVPEEALIPVLRSFFG